MSERGRMAATPMVSIGMPVYNGEKYIYEALDSLLAQTVSDFELIISDNASKDGTEAICRDYAAKESRIRYFRQSDNLGAANNFRFVLDKAKGEYFMWAAYDDFWLPTFISECLAVMKANSDLGFVVTKYKIKSRFLFIFNRMFVPNLRFVTDKNPKQRVLAFSRMPFHTHKDNIVYALWKRDALATLLGNLKSAGLQRLIGGAMLEYALALHRGGFVNKPLFHKKYRYTASGHFLNPVIGQIQRLLSAVSIGPAQSKRNKETSLQGATHLEDVVKVLELARLDDDFIEQIAKVQSPYLEIGQ